jgi:isoleucyl-tRNA synthetase
LKDFVVRYKAMKGFHTEYVPGWDCHGLPIEQKVLQDIAKKKEKVTDALEIRKRCEDYAEKYLDIQRDEFKRLMCIGQWDDPYITMNPKFEVGILSVLRTMVDKGYVYKGQKPV